VSVVVIPANCECCTGPPACDGTFMDSLPATLKIYFTFPAPFAAYSGEHNLIDPGGTTGTSRIWVFDNIDGTSGNALTYTLDGASWGGTVYSFVLRCYLGRWGLDSVSTNGTAWCQLPGCIANGDADMGTYVASPFYMAFGESRGYSCDPLEPLGFTCGVVVEVYEP